MSCSTITPNSEKKLNVSCIGPDNAQSYAIYLHGMDSIVPSKQEMNNRLILKNVAFKHKIRFAAPRAQMICPNQPESLCWGWKFNQSELNSILPKIMESRSECFDSRKSFNILGFSNGGYLLTRWYSNEIDSESVKQITSLITSGSGIGEVSNKRVDLSSNPKLFIIIGNDDKFNYDPSAKFFNQLKTLKAPVELIEFQGKHELNEAALLKVFKN